MGVRYKVVPQEDGTERIDELHTVVVHKFSVGDVDDPQLYAAGPLWEWQESEAGKFVMEHSVEQPTWKSQTDHINWGHAFVVIAVLEKKKLSEFYLRFDKSKL